jgi:hypothetical protein
MIIGVTHDQDGRVVQRLSVSTKVAIGLPPNGDRNHPTKLDHFVFLRKKKSANRVGWEVDPELTEHYGGECSELHIMLIDDDIENVFPSSYAWWTATERKFRQIHSALQEIQTFTGGRLAGITAKLTVRPEEATYFDRKEKRKRTSSI